MTLGPFPTDDVTLQMVLAALDTCYGANHELVGGDFTLNQLLELYSGYDESALVPLGKHGNPLSNSDEDEVEWYLNPNPQYHPNDIIRSLIAEVTRLRELVGENGFSAPEK